MSPGAFRFPVDDLPGKAEYGGYVYVLGLESGVVKIGATTNPRARLVAHERLAAAYGGSALLGWLSPLHESYSANEDRLLEAVGESAVLLSGREYFRGVEFYGAVRLAAGLAFPPVDITAHKAAEEEIRRHFRMHGSPLARALGIGPGSIRLILDAVAIYFGARDDGSYDFEVDPSVIAAGLSRHPTGGVLSAIEEAPELDIVDLFEESAIWVVRTHARKLREFAQANGRPDLLLTLKAIQEQHRDLFDEAWAQMAPVPA